MTRLAVVLLFLAAAAAPAAAAVAGIVTNTDIPANALTKPLDSILALAPLPAQRNILDTMKAIQAGIIKPPANAPYFYVVGWTNPVYPRANSGFTTVAYVANLGAAAPSTSKLQFFANSPATLGCGATGDQVRTIPKLGPLAFTRFSFGGARQAAAGVYTFALFADSLCAVTSAGVNFTLPYTVTANLTANLELNINSISLRSNVSQVPKSNFVLIRSVRSQYAATVKVFSSGSWRAPVGVIRAADPASGPLPVNPASFCGTGSYNTSTTPGGNIGIGSSKSYWATPISPPTAVKASQTVRIIANQLCEGIEGSLNDNAIDYTYSAVATPAPQFDIVSYTTSPAKPLAGGTASLTVVIKNVGFVRGRPGIIAANATSLATATCGNPAPAGFVTQTRNGFVSPNGQISVTLSKLTLPATAGPQFFTVRVDTNCTTTELWDQVAGNTGGKTYKLYYYLS